MVQRIRIRVSRRKRRRSGVITGHVIKDCHKVVVKKKEVGMAVADTSTSKVEFANVVQESEWVFVVHCSYDPSLHDACMSVADSHVWYFDSGATKHITSQRDMFTCLKSTDC